MPSQPVGQTRLVIGPKGLTLETVKSRRWRRKRASFPALLWTEVKTRIDGFWEGSMDLERAVAMTLGTLGDSLGTIGGRRDSSAPTMLTSPRGTI